MSLSKASRRSGRKSADKKPPSNIKVEKAPEPVAEVAAFSDAELDQFENAADEPEVDVDADTPRAEQPTVDDEKPRVIGHIEKMSDKLDDRPIKTRKFIALATVYFDERDNPAQPGDVISGLNREQVERFLNQNAIEPAG